MKKFILLFTFLLLPKVVFADNEFLLSCDKNKINVKNTSRGSNTYDFYKIAYHDIDFDNLTKIK